LIDFFPRCILNASADYSDEKGVRPSVRPSVKRVSDKRLEKSVQIVIAYYTKYHLA